MRWSGFKGEVQERGAPASRSVCPGDILTAVIAGGVICAALVGGILLGIIEIFGKAYISSQMADAIVFAVLIVVLLVKPAGLFGKNIQEKV